MAAGPGTARLATALAVVAIGAAACTSSGTGTGKTAASAAALTPSVPVVSSPSVAPPSSVAASTPVSTPAPTSPKPPPSRTTTAAARSTCTSVSVRTIQAGASPGQEIESLQFTNSGTSTCVLNGFPVVTLLRNGAQIGQASQPSTQGSSSLSLAPGEVAESVLHDYTQTCQAPLSDELRVTVPGMNTTAIRPAQMRACILRVDRLGPPQ